MPAGDSKANNVRGSRQPAPSLQPSLEFGSGDFLPHIKRKSAAAGSPTETPSPASERSSQHAGDDTPNDGLHMQPLPMVPGQPTANADRTRSAAMRGDTGRTPDLLQLIQPDASPPAQPSSSLSEHMHSGSGEDYGGTDLVAALLGRLDRELQGVGAEQPPLRPPRGTRETADRLSALPSMASSAAVVRERNAGPAIVTAIA